MTLYLLRKSTINPFHPTSMRVNKIIWKFITITRDIGDKGEDKGHSIRFRAAEAKFPGDGRRYDIRDKCCFTH